MHDGRTRGPARPGCLQAARDHDARLLVVGAHGWDRIGRLIHGSVSTYVLHHALVPSPRGVQDDEAAGPARGTGRHGTRRSSLEAPRRAASFPRRPPPV